MELHSILVFIHVLGGVGPAGSLIILALAVVGGLAAGIRTAATRSVLPAPERGAPR